jgi:hypothetical protein
VAELPSLNSGMLLPQRPSISLYASPLSPLSPPPLSHTADDDVPSSCELEQGRTLPGDAGSSAPPHHPSPRGHGRSWAALSAGLLLPGGTLCSSLAAPWRDRSLVLRGRSCPTVTRARPGVRRLAGSHARPPSGRQWRRSSRSRWGRVSIPPTIASSGGSCGHGLIGERMHPYSSEELTHGGARQGSLLCLAELARGRRRTRERDFFTRRIHVQGV